MVLLCQVSPNCYLTPLLLLPPKNTFLLLVPFASPLYSHHCITKYIHYLLFIPPLLHNCILPYHVLSPLIFAFFALFMDVHLLLAHLPISTHHIPMLFHLSQPMDNPSIPLAPPCPLPPFSLFLHHLCCFPPTSFFHSPLYYIVSLSSPPGWPIWQVFWLYLMTYTNQLCGFS